MARMQISFDGFKDLTEAIDKAGGDLQKAVDECLNEIFSLVQQEVESASGAYASTGKKGYATGAMYRAIKRDPDIKWTGNVATIGVGFNLRQKDGFHSIFIMYGTPKYGKDTAVYNAVFGTAMRKRIEEKQEEILSSYLKL